MLKIEYLSASYGIVQVLHDLSLTVSQGELVALLGSNGAGKSTTLKAISGLVKIKSGLINFKEEEITNLNAGSRVERGLIQVPEGGRVFPYLTVMENLMIGAAGRLEAWRRREKSIERVLDIFPILQVRRKLQAYSLSGGERQMLAMGRGLMASPSLLMIDEPSLGLAPLVIIKIYETIEQLRKEGVTIFLAEQNVEQALEIADRAYVIENGKIVIEGTSQNLLDNEKVKKAYLGI